MVCWVEALRRQTGDLRAEYALDIHLHIMHYPLSVMAGGASEGRADTYIGHIGTPGVRFPILRFHDTTDGAALLTVLERDLCHAAGINFQQRDEVAYRIAYETR